MLLFRKPSADSLRTFLDAQRSLDFSYTGVGGTAGDPPPGYVVDHTRVELGKGQRVFERAKAGLERWEQFHLGWLEAWPGDTPLENAQVVAVVARAMGFWWLNACRIVYIVDERQPARRFGFAYGTLPGHIEAGEERFLIQWDPADDRVWYDILAFSRPRHVLAWLGYPLVRRMQKQFGRDSAAAMHRYANG
jgi:uncharacterized protein (UPF0548 family)